ncbi:MAG: dTDP-4-dehydrorhamnose reductase [Bdellovibrionales bacterium]|nr:dTDP-4-dehydrorhamnose reductase [Bdellovibrionales bacterium]
MIIVTGASGQLGQEIKKLASSSDYKFVDRSIVDFENVDSVKTFFDNQKIKAVIHAAAYTNVEQAEVDKDIARKINVTSTGIIAEMAKKHKYKMTYISTDFVFDGKKSVAYTESDSTNPLNSYGLTKRDGELAIESMGCDHAIIRTSWVYSTFGNNFVKKIIKLSETQKNLKVIQDQIGSLTYASDLADAILKSGDLHGMYHFSNEGTCSWYDVACEIKRALKLDIEIAPVLSSEFATKAIRPHFSLLSKKKIKDDLKITIPHWADSLHGTIANIKN